MNGESINIVLNLLKKPIQFIKRYQKKQVAVCEFSKAVIVDQ
jgi:hypothetical protein